MTHLFIKAYWLIAPRSPPWCSWSNFKALNRNRILVVFQPLFPFNFELPLLLWLLECMYVAVLKPVRNLVNAALVRGWGRACASFSLVCASSCMTGIISLVFLNEAGCLSSLSSPPLLPAAPLLLKEDGTTFDPAGTTDASLCAAVYCQRPWPPGFAPQTHCAAFT